MRRTPSSSIADFSVCHMRQNDDGFSGLDSKPRDIGDIVDLDFRLAKRKARVQESKLSSSNRVASRSPRKNLKGTRSMCNYRRDILKSIRRPLLSHGLLISVLGIILINKVPLTSGAVARVPYLLDIEAALESSRCTVREEIVDLRKLHPTLPSNAIYMPSCVAVNRCSGCCQSDRLQCRPTSTYVTRMKISQQLLEPFRYEEITLEFTHHDSCACRRLDDPTPICAQRECAAHEIWDDKACDCVTSNAPDNICAIQTCTENENWNQDTCRCEPVCKAKRCRSNEIWNNTSCSCVVEHPPSTCLPIPCGFGQIWNLATCSCEARCQVTKCGRYQYFNFNTCKCECRPCHPKRLFHVRFNQNHHTCQCSCKNEQHGRAACKRKRASYNTNTCTCEHSYAKNHRGRRG